jgi:hypothetical protein
VILLDINRENSLINFYEIEPSSDIISVTISIHIVIVTDILIRFIVLIHVGSMG